MSNQTKKEVYIRVIDIGGNGFRRGNVYGKEVDEKSIAVMPIEKIKIRERRRALSQLKEFAAKKIEIVKEPVKNIGSNHALVKEKFLYDLFQKFPRICP